MKALISGLLVLVSLSTTVFAQIHHQAYVMNGLSENLDVIDLDAGSVTSNVASLGLWPNQIVYHNNQLLVINSGFNNLQIINPQTFATIGTIEFGDNHNPYYLCPIDDDYIAVSQLLDNSVSIVNVTTQQEEASIPVGSGPEGLITEVNELFVTITNYVGGFQQGKVYVIDLATNQVTDTIDVGTNPQWIGRGHDGNLHVLCTGDYTTVFGEVHVVDPYTHHTVQTIPLGSSPSSWAVMESGVAYLGVNIWGGGGYLLAYHTETYQVMHSESNPLSVGGGVVGITAGQDNRLYICVTEADQVKVLDQGENIIATYNVGDGPQSIALSPASSSVPKQGLTIVPRSADLKQNYPNPFNCLTRIPYRIAPDNCEAYIDIINVMGQQVRRFFVRGEGSVIWDGTDQQDAPVSAGSYWVRVSAGEQSNTIKIVFIP
jgi:YVTN family beta-propeller protein